jgi:hypothetical protein
MYDWIATIKVVRTVKIRMAGSTEPFSSKAKIKQQLENYGLIEVVSDYHIWDEDLAASIVKVEPA